MSDLRWLDPETGLPCRAIKVRDLGHWCGYVLLPAGHPWHGKDDSTIPAQVHGGITFSAKDGVWWRIGFDCAHLGDHVPGAMMRPPRDGEVYRDLPFVKAECARLAAQAFAVQAGRDD